jgi:hypothetical protein
VLPAAPEEDNVMSPAVAVKVVTIVAPWEMLDRVQREIRALGARGFTRVHSSGQGRHGPREQGLLDAGNERIETIVPPAVAERILKHVDAKYAGDEVVAFAYDAVGAPRSRFAV